MSTQIERELMKRKAQKRATAPLFDERPAPPVSTQTKAKTAPKFYILTFCYYAYFGLGIFLMAFCWLGAFALLLIGGDFLATLIGGTLAGLSLMAFAELLDILIRIGRYVS